MKKNTITQFCSCQNNKPETVEHYLLHCPTYSYIRYEFFEKLRLIISLLTFVSSSYTITCFLYGNTCHEFLHLINKKNVELTILLSLLVTDLKNHFFQIPDNVISSRYMER